VYMQQHPNEKQKIQEASAALDIPAAPDTAMAMDAKA
jgi:hypothetical protein